MARAQIVDKLFDRDISKITHRIPRGESYLSFVHGDSFPFVSVKHMQFDYHLIRLHFAST